MSPDEWVDRINDAIADAVNTLANIARVGRPAWIGRFEERARMQWRSIFDGILSSDDVDSLVGDITQTIMSRLAEIESAPPTLH